MARIGRIARRGFLLGSAAVAGGVAFGWYRWATPFPNPLTGQGASVLTPYVMIDAQGVTIITPRAEMGQGVHTTLAALVAEEMDLDWAAIRTRHGPAAAAYYNGAILEESLPFPPTDDSRMARMARSAAAIPAKLLGQQVTGGSTSMPDAFVRMRLAGAAARHALVQAAAAEWGLPPGDLRTAGAEVIAPDGRRLPYVALAPAAAQVPLPDDLPLRPPGDWRLLGRSLPRVDSLAKSTGTATFAIDIRLPGMKFATLLSNPLLGGGLAGFDATAALALPGVHAVLQVEDGIAVVADTTWQALQGAALVKADWQAPESPITSAGLSAALDAALDAPPDLTARDDAAEAGAEGQPGGAPALQAEYAAPVLAHATMEPMGAVAWLEGGRLRLWAGSQAPTLARRIVAAATGLDEGAIDLEITLMGGGFGRRSEADFIRKAALIAMAMPATPVLLTYSREEDMAQDMFRPMARARVTAALQDKTVRAFDLRVASASIMESMTGRIGLPMVGPDRTLVQGAWEQPYRLGACRVSGHRAAPGLPLGFWRSVGASQNVFFHESAMDELAHLAGDDPLLFRLRHMDHLPSIRVLETVAEMCGWPAVPPGRARGVAFAMTFGVPVAEVIEVEDTPDGIRLTGAWIAADPGIVLDPGIAETQLSGGMVFGLSAAMNGEITFTEGRIDQTNFWDYEPMRIRQCPPITVRLLQGGGPIRGIGEPGTPPAAPALANAIFALTGTRHRSLPLRHGVTFA